MQAVNFTKLRKNLASLLDKVNEDRTPILITRDGKNDAVLMSLSDFKSYEETLYLLQSPKNAKRLLDSIADIEKGVFKHHELIEE